MSTSISPRRLRVHHFDVFGRAPLPFFDFAPGRLNPISRLTMSHFTSRSSKKSILYSDYQAEEESSDVNLGQRSVSLVSTHTHPADGRALHSCIEFDLFDVISDLSAFSQTTGPFPRLIRLSLPFGCRGSRRTGQKALSF